jgi:hypothetical protein
MFNYELCLVKINLLKLKKYLITYGVCLLPHGFVNIPDEKMYIGVFLFILLFFIIYCRINESFILIQ